MGKVDDAVGKAGNRIGNQSEGSQSMLGRVSQQLAMLEKRDWELWLIVVLTSVLGLAGLLAITFPAAFLTQDDLHFEIRVSKLAFLGLVAIFTLANVYFVTRRLELRRVRQQLISTTIQSEIIRLQSFTDPLTEVYNRRSLDEMAGRYISRARRQHNPLTFLLIDVDRFRDVNTRFGHLTGDFVLAEVAALLKGAVRGSDAVVRYGGDEFLVILGESSAAGAAKVIDRIRKDLAEWNRMQHLEGMEMSVSIGVGEWVDGKTLDEVLDDADQKMYSVKAEH